jgi:hypothetical protein
MRVALFCFGIILLALLSFLGVDPGVLSILLSLSGGGFVWTGVRTRTLLSPMLGLVLQSLAVLLFADAVWYPFGGTILLNSYFLSCCCFVTVAFFSAYWLDKAAFYDVEVACRRHLLRRYFFSPFFILGAGVWFVAGLREIWMHIVVWERLNGTLLFISATSILTGIIAEKIQWNRLGYFLLLQLPALWFLLCFELLRGGYGVQLMSGWGAAAWTVAFFVQYRILALLDAKKGSGSTLLPHLFTLWALLLVVNREIIFGLASTQVISSSGLVIAKLFLPCLYLLFFFVMSNRKWWPVRQYPMAYLWGGLALSIILMIKTF